MTRPPGSRGRVIVFGILFFYPLAGVTYQFLHYLIGLRRLGFDPYYVEDSGRWVYDPLLNDMSPDVTANLARVVPALEQHGFKDRWAFRGRYEAGGCYGLSETELTRLYREADAFLNVTGAQEIYEDHLAVPRRIYVESDPFVMQVREAAGDASTIALLDAHDTHFTFGENIGAPDCGIPASRYRWLPTRQPVVTDLWTGEPSPPDARYTTITTWHNKGKDIEYRGETYYWTKDREFEKFLDLPRRRDVPFELAVGVDAATAARLTAERWRLTSSSRVSGDIDAYRGYIVGSRGEFTVARDQYVRPNTGWFSDRTACYLAAGRPVITQETGFSRFLPSGCGLFGFRTMDDVLAAVDAIEGDYARHAHGARDVAIECFEAERVVGSLMARAGL